MAAEPAPPPRQRARAQAITDIKRIAREQLIREGAAGLSLRAVARELGIVSSAVYRYVPSRGELLTMLIEDAYNALGEAAETADTRHDRTDRHGRWMSVGRAVRDWAVHRPAEYALLYGSPMPGCRAQAERTGAPGSRVSLLLLDVLAGAPAPAGGSPRPPLPAALRADLRALRSEIGVEIDEELMARGVLAWTALFGLVSFEVYGQYVGSISDYAAHFDFQLARLADSLGLVAD
ncbi:AcrR family transcriptional regulator [Actinoalloteichus hoggarensis]|uniref:Putative HTH-type transcriptional regulator n=1 Tax=Actinoalloteichus hoggarensis TaxID=1470176 RepID=A0A221W5L4_9PSEU|nr:TetR/AcrR family transcriptional regulator [Actinoalloteichus hoggarensis]ASO20807.1 putative HTH-type transcriptional regulator [Actinoalloteichus hoggarensis]MBB5920736.1 AcrR family transcriptional regulator [Actinoalloteichus hoggarensis]